MLKQVDEYWSSHHRVVTMIHWENSTHTRSPKNLQLLVQGFHLSDDKLKVCL